MTTLKDHQATMVSMLASGTAIPTSAIRLAHALHDVLAHINDTNAAPEAHTERRIDATTPGLNDVLLAADVQAVSPKQQSIESLLKQRDNTIRQLSESNLKLRQEKIELEFEVDSLKAIPRQTVSGGGLNSCEHSWCDTGHELYCKHCGIHPSDLPEQAGCRKEDTQCHHIPFKGADGGTYCDNCGVEL